jgi:hypothetical protein
VSLGKRLTQQHQHGPGHQHVAERAELDHGNAFHPAVIQCRRFLVSVLAFPGLPGKPEFYKLL